MRRQSKTIPGKNVAQIKEHKTWPRCVIKHLLFFLFLSEKLVLRLTGSFAPPLPLANVSFLSLALELRRVFRLTVYLLRARVPQVIPSRQSGTIGENRVEKVRAMNSRILLAVFMVSVPRNLFNYRARTMCGTALL